ncbi:MAG: hypothetical protein LC122_12995 [Chitinophagales bacterium]|nr:hypothetical protein [Chitinophagales bacterium]
MRNEIFNNFAKIAEDQGLLKTREDKIETKELYKLKPETAKDMDYENNILEVAHKDSVFIADTYDPMHSLVENENERKKIITNIVMKNPSGTHSNKKYAETQLMLSLMKIANISPEYEKVAKTCVSQLKKAASPLLLIGAATSILALVYAQQHLPKISQGLLKDYSSLVSEIDDVLGSSSPYLFGKEYSSLVKQLLNNLKSKASELVSIYKEVDGFISEMYKPKTGQELLTLANSPEAANANSAFEKFQELKNKYIAEFNSLIEDFKDESFKLRNISQKGKVTELAESIPGWQFLSGGKGLIKDDLDDIVESLQTFKKSLDSVSALFDKAKNLKLSAQQKLTEEKTPKEEKEIITEKLDKEKSVSPVEHKQIKKQKKAPKDLSSEELLKQIKFKEPSLDF